MQLGAPGLPVHDFGTSKTGAVGPTVRTKPQSAGLDRPVERRSTENPDGQPNGNDNNRYTRTRRAPSHPVD